MDNITKSKSIKVTLIKSPIGTKQSHRATVRGLGLRKLNSYSMLLDTPETRGMIIKLITYLNVKSRYVLEFYKIGSGC